MISESSRGSGAIRAIRSLALVILGSAICGCDSAPPGSSMPTEKVLDKPLPQEKLEKWVGEGATKHKEMISREERIKLIRESSKKSVE